MHDIIDMLFVLVYIGSKINYWLLPNTLIQYNGRLLT